MATRAVFSTDEITECDNCHLELECQNATVFLPPKGEKLVFDLEQCNYVHIPSYALILCHQCSKLFCEDRDRGIAIGWFDRSEIRAWEGFVVIGHCNVCGIRFFLDSEQKQTNNHVIHSRLRNHPNVRLDVECPGCKSHNVRFAGIHNNAVNYIQDKLNRRLTDPERDVVYDAMEEGEVMVNRLIGKVESKTLA